MRIRFTFAMALLLSLPVHGQAYRWVDDKGVTSYGDKPPSGRPARPVDTQPAGTLESIELQKRLEAERRQQADARAAGAQAQPQVAATAPARGMTFETYIRLQRGMTEGELILRAGRPDHESVENFRNNIVKSLYYYPTIGDPYITVVTLRGGRIAEIERTRKTF